MAMMKMTKFHIPAALALFVAMIAASGGKTISSWHLLQRSNQPPGGEQVRTALNSLATGRGDWTTFSVTYDDLHPMHGGLTLTIHGDGHVEKKVLRMESQEPRQVSRPDLERLVSLLQEIHAWEQRTPERNPVPDESRSLLIVRSGKAETTIWEWYNDMRSNNRIVRVRDLMTEIAMPKAGH
jgi:hypothetical protein